MGPYLSSEFQPIIDQLALLMSEPAIDMLKGLFEMYPPAAMPIPVLHGERWRLCCEWSRFFENYPIVIGPTWTDDPFLHDMDINEGGARLTVDTLRFITPANLMGLPAAAVPTGVHNGIPTGVQVLADRWRDDLSLQGAGIIEARLGQITPIDPVF